MPGAVYPFPIPPAPGTTPILAWDGAKFAPSTALALVSITLSGALAAASLTATGLTPGGVPYISTGGLLAYSAGLLFDGTSALTVGAGTSSAALRIDGLGGTARLISHRTAGVNRWQVGANGTAEAGADAGSNFVISALTDAGAAIDTPLSIARVAGGAITLTRPLQPGSGSAGAPSYAFSTDTTTGIFRISSGTMSHVASGTEYLRESNAQWTYSRNASVALGTAPVNNVAMLSLHAPDAVSCQIALCAYGAGAGVISRRAEGTAALPTQIINGSAIRSDVIIGYEATTPGFTANKNTYLVIGSESWTSTAQGFFHRWDANNTGTTSPLEKMRLIQGNLLIGTTTDGMTANGSLAVAQDLAHRGTKIGLMNTSPIAQKTGYGTPTGNAYQASFAAGSITLPNLAAAVAQLILDLKAYGLIGA